jgi:hypothetical protein
VKAELEKGDAHEVTVAFSERITAVDFRNGVTINVNGKPAHILEAARQPTGDAVRYRIATTIHPFDLVTWAYDGANGTIQNLDGGNMLSVRPKIASVRKN